MRISLIAAMSSNRVIGRNNDLPWRLPDDMKFFKETTSGHMIVMGRKNYESIPSKFRPLPDRTNVVLTRNTEFTAQGCEVFNDIQNVIQFGIDQNETELFIIGGGEIYEIGLELADRIYLTEIDEKIDGDTFFPSWSDEWKEVKRTHHPKDDKHKYAFDFLIYEKSK